MVKQPESSQVVDLSKYVQPKQAAQIIGFTDGRLYQMLRPDERNRWFSGADLIFIGEKPRLVARKAAERLAKKPATTGRPRKNSA